MRNALFLLALLPLAGCGAQVAGEVVGSRSADTLLGPAYYLIVEAPGGAVSEVRVSVDEYHDARIGDRR